jgi:hypothetical protein
VLVGEVPGNLKHDWPKTWRRYVQRMFDYVDAFVTTSFATKEGFSECVREIGPSFAGNFLIWPEIYCRTLTQAWAAGVPVLAARDPEQRYLGAES